MGLALPAVSPLLISVVATGVVDAGFYAASCFFLGAARGLFILNTWPRPAGRVDSLDLPAFSGRILPSPSSSSLLSSSWYFAAG